MSHLLLFPPDKIHTNQNDPVEFNRKELELYMSPYFADMQTRRNIIDVFWGDDSLTDNQLDLRDVLKRINQRERAGGVKLADGDVARNLRVANIVIDQNISLDEYRNISREELGKFVVASFRFCVIQLSQLLENQLWFSGDKDSITIPQSIKQKLELLASIEKNFSLPRYTEQLQNSLAAVISYYYPSLVSNKSMKVARNLKKVKLSLDDISDFDTDNTTQDLNNYEEGNKILFTMNPDVAKAYNFGEYFAVYCSVRDAEEILGADDDLPIFLRFRNRIIKMTARTFKLVFHKGEVPDKDEIGDGVILDFER